MKKQKGITLIELMIVVAVLAIIVAIAYPTYIDQVRKTRRKDGMSALTTGAQALERCYTTTNDYTNATCTALFPITSDDNWYIVTITASTSTTFTLTATAQNDQASDVCANLTLDHTGAKGSSSGRADCWN
jgi:type IV pilus assembly protein PilE